MEETSFEFKKYVIRINVPDMDLLARFQIYGTLPEHDWLVAEREGYLSLDDAATAAKEYIDCIVLYKTYKDAADAVPNEESRSFKRRYEFMMECYKVFHHYAYHCESFKNIKEPRERLQFETGLLNIVESQGL